MKKRCSPFLRASCWWNDFCHTSFDAHVIPALVSLFYTFWPVFLTLDLFLSATHKGWKKSIRFIDVEFYAECFDKKKKKIIKKIIKKVNQILQNLAKFSVCPSAATWFVFGFYRFPDTFGKLSKNQNWLIRSRKISFNRGFLFFDYLKRKSF